MSCNRYHFDMSENLDGRLPSGRREALMGHLAECGACSALWDEMLAAQELAFSLPEQAATAEFSETLWNRIRSGEGTPDAVFHEPIPVLTKVRYVLTGAAAAAIVLALGNVLFGGGTGNGPDTDARGPGTGEQVARAGSGDVERRTLRPDDGAGIAGRQVYLGDPGLRAAGLQPVTPQSIAEAGALTCVNSIIDLQRELPRAEAEIRDLQPEVVLIRLEHPVGELRGATNLLRWMEDRQIIELPPELNAELRVAEESLRILERPEKDVSQVRIAFRQLQQVDVGKLSKRFRIMCCQDPREFMVRLREHVARNPDSGRILHFTFPDPGLGFYGNTTGPQPFALGMILLRTTPESRVELRVRGRVETVGEQTEVK